jgi:outer membrane protein TolC
MTRFAGRFALGVLLSSSLVSGCALLPEAPVTAVGTQPPAVHASANPAALAPESVGPAFPQASVLSVDALVQEVLARNPTLPQMTAARQAASAKIPQVTSLEDPFFGATIAPASIGSSDVEFGYRLEVSQKLPWPGKLGLRGAGASAEANAAGSEVEDARLQLIEAARTAFYDYYLVDRAGAVNKESLKLLATIRKAVNVRFVVDKDVGAQELYQLDVETGKQRERALLLDRLRKVAVARLNTLMHLVPDLPLPPPPEKITVEAALPEAAALRAGALSRRPDLAALRSRIAAEEAALGLADRESYPDFDVMAAYDTIMGNGPTRDLAAQLAVRINLPVRKTRRMAAVSEAESKLAQRRAELARMTDQANYEVQQAYEQVRESERVMQLYEKEILPAAGNNVRAAQAAYVPGKIPLIALIEAQRNSVNLQDRYYEVTADYFRRLAMLERAAGGSLSAASLHGSPQSSCGDQPH